MISLTAKARKYKEGVKMGRQKNRLQIKEQDYSPEEELEMEASNLSDREFRVMIMRILNSMKKDIRTIKKVSQK